MLTCTWTRHAWRLFQASALRPPSRTWLSTSAKANAHSGWNSFRKSGFLRHRRRQAQAEPSPSSPTMADETNLILGRALKMTTSSTIRCTIIDGRGTVTAVNAEFKRNELLSRYGLLPRDLRKLDTSTHNIVPAILPRENSILISLLHIRALIKADTVILFDTQADDSRAQSLFLYDLEHKLKNKSSGLPYEQRALEAVLISVLNTLGEELKVHSLVVNDSLSGLEKGIDRDKLRHLLVNSKQLSAFLQKVTLIRDALEELIDSDDTLADLHLSAKLAGEPLSAVEDHSDLEIMLESYYNQSDEIVQTVESLAANIRSTEEVTTIVLDSNRNTLMLLELKFQIGMMALSGGSVIAALYGMNLKNFIEDEWWGFGLVSALVGLTSLVMVVYSLRHLQRVQRLHMGSSEAVMRQTKARVPATAAASRVAARPPSATASAPASPSGDAKR